MNNSLSISKTGLSAQDTKMSTISNNLANVNTVGFKRDRANFEDLFYQIQRQPGAAQDNQNDLPTGIQVGSGVRVSGTQKEFTQGSFQTTGNQLDIAIAGQGFFQIAEPNGDLSYTRNGQFTKNSDGLVVNSEGLPLVPNIQIPDDALNVSISNDGIVTAQTPGDPAPVQIGQINTVNFANPAGLEAVGGNLLRETQSSGAPIEGPPGFAGLGDLKQGMLEGSNVKVVEEMVNLITVQRGYEMNVKVVSAADDMLSFMNQAL